MGYLEIKKKIKKKALKKESIELNVERQFKPNINIDNYLSYAYNNYEMLLELAKDYHQKEIIDRKINLEKTYFLKKADWLSEVYKTNKEEYYKRLYIFEYLEYIIEQGA